MKFSKTTEYALRTMIFLSRNEGINNTRKISDACDIPYKYFQKISHLLSQRDLIDITRGKHGGFALGRSPKEIPVVAIIDAATEKVDRDDACRLYGDLCSHDNACDSCALRQNVLKIEAYEKQLLTDLTLYDIAIGDGRCCSLDEYEANHKQKATVS